MSEEDPQALKISTYLPQTPAPRPISPGQPSHLKRVGRPLRHVKYIPTKQLIFYSKYKEPTFTYDIKIKTPIKSNTLVIQIKSSGLNPIDLKIKNAYSSNFNYERGIGREYSGKIIAVGDKHKSSFKEGDEVCGLYFHPNSLGTISSDIQIDPNIDPIIKKPKNLSWEESGSWCFTFGAAWQLLKQVEKSINSDSIILINGGTSSVGMMCIQLLKNYYKIDNIVSICSGSGVELTKKIGSKIAINYTTNSNLPKTLNILTTTGVYKDYDSNGDFFENRSIPGKKFNLIIDCIGGYKLLEKINDYLIKGGSYITTVGDYKHDYKNDVYNSWKNPAMNARSIFGSMWSMQYFPFNFNPKVNKNDENWLSIGVDLLENEEIKVIIDEVFDWRDYKKAEQKLMKGHAHGKIVLNIEDF